MARLASATLHIGDAAPPLVLPALDGQPVELAALLQQGAVLLVFAPGIWSPNVRRQLVELAAAHERLLADRVQVVMVVTQDRRRVVERLTYVAPPFAVLSDEQRVAARDYGVYCAFSRDGLRVTRPALFLVDTEGVLRLIYVGQGDSDIVDTPTVVRLTCWLVGSPLLEATQADVVPEATPPDAELAAAEPEAAAAGGTEPVLITDGVAELSADTALALAPTTNGVHPIEVDGVAAIEVVGLDANLGPEGAAMTGEPAGGAVATVDIAEAPEPLAGGNRLDGEPLDGSKGPDNGVAGSS